MTSEEVESERTHGPERFGGAGQLGHERHGPPQLDGRLEAINRFLPLHFSLLLILASKIISPWPGTHTLPGVFMVVVGRTFETEMCLHGCDAWAGCP